MSARGEGRSEGGPPDFVVLVVFVDEVEENCTGFEDHKVSILKGRDFPVRLSLQVFRSIVFVLRFLTVNYCQRGGSYIQYNILVVNAQFLQGNRDFHRIR